MVHLIQAGILVLMLGISSTYLIYDLVISFAEWKREGYLDE